LEKDVFFRLVSLRMPVYSYRTIRSASEGSYKEKGSRFLSFAYPVDNEEAIRDRLEALRREYFDARHHCYAWMLGADKKRFRAADDGEPNHSAGDPILGQIRSNDITNILIVVVRYFGGIKLGVGGLIAAYRQAAADVLRSATIIEEEVMVPLRLAYPYEKSAEVMRMIKDYHLSVVEQSYEERCQLTARLSLKNMEGALVKIRLLNSPVATIEIIN
jgi:uncharacterized YigZ family protein